MPEFSGPEKRGLAAAILEGKEVGKEASFVDSPLENAQVLGIRIS